MTENMAELVWDVVRGISTSMHKLLQNQYQSTEKKAIPPDQQPVWLSLPVQISLLLQPGNKPLSSAVLQQSLSLTPQEIRSIEVQSKQNHLSKEAVLLDLLKTALYGHEKMQEIVRQVHQQYSRDTQVIIAIELLGPIRWEEGPTTETA